MNWNFFADPAEVERAATAMKQKVAVAATGAIRDTGDMIKREGRENIAGAGFSKRWQNAMRVNLYPSKGISLHPALVAFHKIPYAGVFEMGATIAGKPLLWLPLPNVPTSIRGRHMTPANYIRMIGPLVSIRRTGGRPLLGGYIQGGKRGSGKITIAKLVAGARAGKGAKGLVLVPLFYALDSVTLRKRFNLGAVFQKGRDGLGVAYLRNLK